MFSRNSLIQILHRLTSVCTLLAVLTTYSLPAFAQSISASDMLARCDSPDASMPAPRKFDPATRAGKPVVVVVDSRPVDYATFAPWARANVVEFRFLSCGLNALRMATAVKPALWMINVELPEMTGFDLLKMLRVTIEDQLVVMVADQYQPQNELRSAELNASFFACKPLDVS